MGKFEEYLDNIKEQMNSLLNNEAPLGRAGVNKVNSWTDFGTGGVCYE